MRGEDAAPFAKALDTEKRSLLKVIEMADSAKSPRNGSDFFVQLSEFGDKIGKSDTHFLLRKLRSLFEGKCQQVRRAMHAIVQSQSPEFHLFSDS